MGRADPSCRNLSRLYRDIANPQGSSPSRRAGERAWILPVVGGLIASSDLASGHIDHAIAIMVREAAEGVFDFPLAHRW